MEAETVVKLTLGDLMTFVGEAVKMGIEKFTSEQVEDKLLSQAQARKIMKIGDKKLKELIFSGKLEATENGKIFNHSIHKYLKGENK